MAAGLAESASEERWGRAADSGQSGYQVGRIALPLLCSSPPFQAVGPALRDWATDGRDAEGYGGLASLHAVSAAGWLPESEAAGRSMRTRRSALRAGSNTPYGVVCTECFVLFVQV